MTMITKITRRGLLGAGAGGVALLGAPAILRAQGASVLRVGTVAVAPHPVLDVLAEFKKQVEAKTSGAINVQVFPSSQLGGEKEMAEGMRLGSLEGANITLAAVTTWVPQGGIFDLPFVFKNDDHALRIYNGAVGKRVADLYPAQGFRVLGFTLSGVRNLFSTFPVEKPDDVKGRKMRTLQSPLHIQIWSLMGANPTPIAHPEVYNALQTKVVDIADNTATNYLNEKWYEPAPNYSTTGHIYAIGAFYLSERWFQRQKPEHREVMMEVMASLVPVQHKAILDGDAESLKKSQAAGAKIINIANKEAWSAPMRPIWEQWAGTDTVRKDLLQSLSATA